MTAVIYAYPPDFLIAAMVARQFERLGARAVVAIDQSDPLLVLEGIEIVRTSFDRRGNLNGWEFVAGNLRLMERLAKRHGSQWVIKCDADTWPLSLDWVNQAGAIIASGVWTAGHLSGCCYAIAASALPILAAEAEAQPPAGYVMEDHATGELARQCGHVHFPKRGTAGCVHFPWKEGRGLDWCKEVGAQVVNFPATVSRRVVLEIMKTFVP
jgi:hypothetical protein